MPDPRFEIRPLREWTQPKTAERRSSGVFRASWNDTVKMLLTEAGHLGAPLVVVQVDADASDIRRDGMLRARASVGFPGVKVSFESKHGPLTYATDVYSQWYPAAPPGWQANLRAIALSLEALRAVDRYGATRSGEQYQGFTALSDKPAGHDDLTLKDAQLVFADALGVTAASLAEEFRHGASVNRMYRVMARKHHPDVGGNESVFGLITRARDVLLAHTERSTTQ